MTDEEKIKLASQIAINFGIDFMDAKCRVEQAFMNFGKEFDMSTETSDKNVAKAKILIEEFNTYNDLDGIQDLKQYSIAIQNLLSEREKDKKKIQELEEENRIFALEGSKIKLSLYIKENYIPKQKIKDKIEKLKNKLKFIACFKDCNKCFDKKGKVLYRGSDFIPCYAYHQIKILQELLED